MPKISVIVPVYNVEEYLKRSMDCLLNQTLKDIEIICIDDGSEDNSLAVLKEYAQKDSRFKIIALDKNYGAAYARNRGLEIATGEYLGFIDPDDAIDLNYYEELYKRAKQGDFDIVKCSRTTIRKTGEKTARAIQKKILKRGLLGFLYEWTCAIYRHSIIKENNIKFPEDILKSEDTVFLNRVILKAKTISLVKNVFYYYYKRDKSLNSAKIPLENIKSSTKAYLLMMDEINESKIHKSSPDLYIKYYMSRLEVMIMCNLYRNASPEAQEIVANAAITGFWKCLDIKSAEKHFPYNSILKYIKNKDVKGLTKYFNKFKSFSDFNNPYSFMDNIFSVKKSPNKKYRVITILGIKIKIKRTNVIEFPEDEELKHEKLMKEILEMTNANKSKIFYLRYTNRCVYIFTEKFLKEYPDFSFDFLQKPPYMGNGCVFKILKKNSKLYKLHIKKFNDNLLCQKYIRALNGVSATEIKTSDGELIISRDFIGKENAFFIDRWTWGDPKPRKFVNGYNFGDYVEKQSYDEKLKLLKIFYDWLFAEYKTDDPDLISGVVADCHLNNFIMSNDNKFHFIDPEWKSNLPIDKSYCIYWSLMKYGNYDLYHHFISFYNLKDKSEEYDKFQKERFQFKEYFGEKKWKKMKQNNKKLIDLYIGGKGIK